MLNFQRFCATKSAHSALALLAGILLLQTFAQAQSPTVTPFALKSGDRVVFYGDSITAQRSYTRFVEEYVLTRYPQLNVQFFNAGVGGDRVSGGSAGPIEERLERDLFAYQPTVVTIMLGMNDGGYRTNDSAIVKQFQTGYRQIVDKIKSRLPGTRIYLIQPSPYDEIAHTSNIPGYNKVLIQFGEFIRQLAFQEHVEVLDGNLPIVTLMQTAVVNDPKLAAGYLPDHVHPSPYAHWILATAIVKAMHGTPIVSSVSFSATALEVTAVSATVKGLKASNGGLEWNEIEAALPLPINPEDPMAKLTFKSSDLADMDQEILKVTDLPSGKYQLKIDTIDVATYTAEELAAGVNLVLHATPMTKQSLAADRIADARVRIDQTRFELLTQSKGFKGQKTGIDFLRDWDDWRLDQEVALTQPVAHNYAIVPAAK